jgi:hypothetical protein
MPDSAVEKIVEAENAALDVFNEKWVKAKDNARFYGLKQWSDIELSKFREQNRLPYQFDKTSHAMNTLLGTQREGRLDIQFLEREPQDAPRNQVLNSVWKYYADTNNFMFQESDVFQDGIINMGAGIFEVGIDKSKNIAGDLKVGRVPFDECLWDTNGRQYDLSDSSWFSRRGFSRRDALIARYPDAKDIIEQAGRDADAEPKVRPIRANLWYDPKKELVGFREFYERATKKKYLIWQVGSEEPEPVPYESKKDAEARIAERLSNFERLSAQASLMGLPVVPAPNFKVLPFDVPIVNKTCAVLNGVLEESEFELADFPFSVFFAYFNDGDFWTAIERYKDPQKFYNRMMIQADYSIGTGAKGVLWIDPRTSKAEEKAIREQWAKTGGIIKSKYMPVQIESKGPAPQLFSMMDRAEGIMDDTFGGANNLGMKQTASESGRAVLARQQQAGLDNFVVLDNFRRTKSDLGKKIAWFLTNKITSAKKLRITGSTFEIQAMQKMGLLEPHPFYPTQGYMQVNTGKENTLADLEVDVVVGEAQYSPNRMMASLSSMTDAFKSGMVAVPPPPDVAIDILPIPQDIKERWKATAQPEKEPPMKIAGNYKDLPPDVKLQILNEMGFQVSPQSVVAKEVIDKPHLTQKEQGGSQ